MAKLKKVFLIDDDPVTNFVNRKILDRLECADEIIDFVDAKDALDHLKELECAEDNPDLILLDINMPGMDGWEFLDHFKQLHNTNKEDSVVMMLSASLRDSDKDKAEQDKTLSGFISKPLTYQTVENLLDNYFNKD